MPNAWPPEPGSAQATTSLPADTHRQRPVTDNHRHGNPWLKAVPGQTAVSAARTKNTYLAARYRRLAARCGKKRALVAVEHSVLIAMWHMLAHDVEYADLGGQYFRPHRPSDRRFLTRFCPYGDHVSAPAKSKARMSCYPGKVPDPRPAASCDVTELAIVVLEPERVSATTPWTDQELVLREVPGKAGAAAKT